MRAQKHAAPSGVVLVLDQLLTLRFYFEDVDPGRQQLDPIEKYMRETVRMFAALIKTRCFS
jgi:hypothetical protein